MKLSKSHVIFSLLLAGSLFLSTSSVNADTATQRFVGVTSATDHQIDCQSADRLATPSASQFACTKFCKDCQTCETYCCAGTTPEDLEVIYIDDDE